MAACTYVKPNPAKLLPSFVCALHSSPQLDSLLSLRSGRVDDPTAEVGEAPEALCL